MENLVNDIVAVDRRIKAVDGGARETPLDLSAIFSERTGVGFLLKGEHLQRTGSFKLRGAMNKVLGLGDADRERGIITASSGNHGMATTQAARVGGVQATIYLPESVSPLKAALGQSRSFAIPPRQVCYASLNRHSGRNVGKAAVSGPRSSGAEGRGCQCSYDRLNH